jgi:hypothetical protein
VKPNSVVLDLCAVVKRANVNAWELHWPELRDLLDKLMQTRVPILAECETFISMGLVSPHMYDRFCPACYVFERMRSKLGV